VDELQSQQKAFEELKGLSDDTLARLSFAMPWQYTSEDSDYRDPDGFDERPLTKDTANWNREKLQLACWDKFHKNPQVNTAVRGQVGRLTGWGFQVSSPIWDIQEIIEDETFDWRNRLYNFWPKYVARAVVEGELFLILTLHNDGFVEVDFLDPSVLDESKGDGSGILFHPGKTTMPLAYCLLADNGHTSQIPSIFIARFPELKKVLTDHKDYRQKQYSASRTRGFKYRKIGSFMRYIVAWDRGFVTRRNISYLRTTLEWLNHYENLKKYEIDHKKSSGAYLWVVTMEDPKAFRLWLSLSDVDKKKTSILQKKTPGGTIILPPGMKMTSQNPTLPKISEQDTDIMHMITGGLNEPEDVSTGQATGTYASVKASRGPMSDRISDEIAWFDRFLKFDFWASIFLLKAAMGAMKDRIKVRMAVDFKGKEPVFQNVARRPEQLIDVSYPTSEVVDYETRAKGLLGSKHGSLYDTMGMPNKELAKRMGFGNYHQLRLRQATEEDNYPDTILTIDQESMQERVEGETTAKRRKEIAAKKKKE